MAVNQTAPAECAVAAPKHSASGLRTRAVANHSRMRRTLAVQTNPHCRRRWHSRLQSRPRVQLLLASIKFLRLKRSVTRATRRFTLPGVGFHDFLCLLMLLTRLAVGLEPLNALGAAHRSPRSAPLSCARNLVPPLDRLLSDPLSETKNWRNIWLSRLTVKLGIGRERACQ
jgi:hypothetical protein